MFTQHIYKFFLKSAALVKMGKHQFPYDTNSMPGVFFTGAYFSRLSWPRGPMNAKNGLPHLEIDGP